jgi:chloride channel 3/4/5
MHEACPGVSKVAPKMSPPGSSSTEVTPLLSPDSPPPPEGWNRDDDVESTRSSKNEPDYIETTFRERLPYNDYTTIDWLRDLAKDSLRVRYIYSQPGIRGAVKRLWDKCQGWVAATIIGVLTAVVAYAVDVNVATISDLKEGYCSNNVFLDRDSCCHRDQGKTDPGPDLPGVCTEWHPWATTWGASYAIYVALAVLYAMIAGSITMTTRTNLPAANGDSGELFTESSTGKMMYMAAGSGIPEIKTILSGFVIPHFLDFKVLVVKAIGATFAVSTGMCLGKEGPFVHISTCVGYQVSNWFPKYRDNSGKMREMLSVACSSGLSVAFGAPIGGVLFSYEVRLPVQRLYGMTDALTQQFHFS